MDESVLIVGVGSGLSASLARLCFSKGMKVVLAARNIEKLEDLKKEVNIYFKSVRVLSPLASRKTSSEVYVIAKNRKS